MDDSLIIELYFARNEKAISLTADKYNSYCYAIAHNILMSHEDAEECVNDTYIKLWNAIPPARPSRFCAFIGKITRNLALDRYRRKKSEHNFANVKMAFEELEMCLTEAGGLDLAEEIALRDAVNSFLAALPKKSRVIFIILNN